MNRNPVSRLALGALALVLAATAAPSPAISAEPTSGTIQGRFVDRDGQGLSGFRVSFEGDAGYASSWTDEEGQFRADVNAGRYRIQFHQVPEGPWPPTDAAFIQYVPGTDDREQATLFEVAAGQTLTVDETIYPNGSITGRFTDAAGNPMAGLAVAVSREDLPWFVFAYTNSDGQYRFPRLRANDGWRVQFQGYEHGFSQYAYGATDVRDAARIAVVHGEETVVNDSRLLTGSVRVIAKDETTGEPIPAFSASLGHAGYSEGTDGQALITDVPVGRHLVSIDAYGYHGFTDGATVIVKAGELSEVEVRLRGKPRIEAAVLDAVTGEPVGGVCLIAAQLQRFSLPDGCGSVSSPSGKAVVETSGTGWFQVLAFPDSAPGYGAQWVGATGGSGSQLEARLIKVEEGKPGKAPVIKMDRAGTVTGAVRRPDGTPAAEYGIVSIGDFSSFAGPGTGTVNLDEHGRYTIDFLGPYRWPLRFAIYPEGSQFSGGVGNRWTAQTIKVVAGQTTTYDFQFRKPVTFTANITGVTGDCYVFASNAVTGDSVMEGWSGDCTQPVEDYLVGPQIVKLSVMYLDGETWRTRWYGGDDFGRAKPVFIPSSGSKSVTIRF